jgi:hypothetical protein
MVSLTRILMLLLLALSSAADYYKVLGIRKGASEREIKKGYRKMALKFHPDKNQDNKEDAEKQFLEVSRAYAVLSEPEKRKLYDECGEACLDQNGNVDVNKSDPRQQHRSGPPFSNGGPTHSNVRFTNEDAEEIFKQFFGGGGFGGGGLNFGGGSNFGGSRSNLRQQPQQQRLFPKQAIGKPKVAFLTGDRFPGLGKHTDNSHVWMILLCSHNDKNCRDYASVWQKLAKLVHPVVKVGTVDCSASSNSQICQRFITQKHQAGKPLVLRVGISDTSAAGKFAIFQRKPAQSPAQQVEQLARFAYAALPTKSKLTGSSKGKHSSSSVYKLHNVRTPQHLDSFLKTCRDSCASGTKPRKGERGAACSCVLIFSSKYESTPAAKAIAAHLSSQPATGKSADAIVGEVRASSKDHTLAKKYGVTSHPDVIIVAAQDGKEIRRYKPKGGVYSAHSILKFIRS